MASRMEVPVWTLKPHPTARPICEGRVRAIMHDEEALEVPVIVTVEGEIIDGMHRVEARKRLNLLHVNVVFGRLEDIDRIMDRGEDV